ncbi:hypothetical protein E2I00_005164, partial [Balaenoptera physalus]
GRATASVQMFLPTRHVSARNRLEQGGSWSSGHCLTEGDPFLQLPPLGKSRGHPPPESCPLDFAAAVFSPRGSLSSQKPGASAAIPALPGRAEAALRSVPIAHGPMAERKMAARSATDSHGTEKNLPSGDLHQVGPLGMRSAPARARPLSRFFPQLREAGRRWGRQEARWGRDSGSSQTRARGPGLQKAEFAFSVLTSSSSSTLRLCPKWYTAPDRKTRLPSCLTKRPPKNVQAGPFSSLGNTSASRASNYLKVK